ncbi:remorin-like [Lotus japonicus]|uniref:Remorin C-terminal domain-containing protein n=1 Tax=Lotus japonicus TaxID=34305 RepID=I3T094_LOTJA|nr:remorin-like [Lotus japonicus]AFK45936.1 unknown [Lotus japonicus]
MTEEQPKKVESESPSNPPPPAPAPTESTPAPEAEAKPEPVVHDAPKEDVAEEKSIIPQPSPPESKPVDDSKAIVKVEKTQEAAEEKPLEGSINRDAVLTRVATEKRLSLIKAWEESEKSIADNKAHKKLSDISAWENSKIAAKEVELRKIEENLEKKKAVYVEKLKNKIAMVHREAEEKRAFIEAKKGEDLLKAEELAAKYRATGTAPKKPFSFF